nr:MAG TPA: hypothetical protein [Caudoviricetes sp.]
MESTIDHNINYTTIHTLQKSTLRRQRENRTRLI